MFDFEYTWQMWENRKGWGPISGSNLDIILYICYMLIALLEVLKIHTAMKL